MFHGLNDRVVRDEVMSQRTTRDGGIEAGVPPVRIGCCRVISAGGDPDHKREHARRGAIVTSDVQGDVQSVFGAAGLHRPMLLHETGVEPWFGQGMLALQAGEHTVNMDA
jgi:hypothetical protein